MKLNIGVSKTARTFVRLRAALFRRLCLQTAIAFSFSAIILIKQCVRPKSSFSPQFQFAKYAPAPIITPLVRMAAPFCVGAATIAVKHLCAEKKVRSILRLENRLLVFCSCTHANCCRWPHKYRRGRVRRQAYDRANARRPSIRVWRQ